MCARDALEGLELEDGFENRKPLKNEFTNAKVKKRMGLIFVFTRNVCIVCSNIIFNIV